MYGSAHKWKKFKQFVNMYICCVVCRFHYPLPPMHEIIKLRPFEINGNDPFSKQYLHTQAKRNFNL
jgi:hypothetical protein